MGQNSSTLSNEFVVIGNFGAPFGVKGWLRVNSYTYPKENVWNFQPWFLEQTNEFQRGSYIELNILQYSVAKELVLLQGILDRNLAAKITNQNILIKRSSLPSLGDGEFYWVDLIGCKVYNTELKFIGILDHLFFNGANDVMVIKSCSTEHNELGNNIEYLVPYNHGITVKEIDLNNKMIKVEWDFS